MFDEEEAIATGDESEGLNTQRTPAAGEDNSGMGPVDAGVIDTGDNSGMGPVDAAPASSASQPTGNPEERTGPNGPIAQNLRAFPGNVKRIVNYLMGGDAADPAVLNQVGAQVDPQGQLSPDDRNLLAIQKVAEEQGPEAAWKLAQANRVAYNAKQAFAYTAMNGTAQKRPDLNAAIDAANQAASHVLDGSNVHFQASTAGQITATVTDPSGQRRVLDLSPDAFRRYLNLAGAGQYDRVSEAGVPKTLEQLARGAGVGQDRIDQLRPMQKKSAPQPQGAINDDGTPYVAPVTGTSHSNFGSTPSTMNLSGTTTKREQTPDEAADFSNASLEERAQRMFPSASQTSQRNQWMSQEMQRDEANQNRLAIEKTKGGAKVEAADVSGNKRVEQENARQQGNKEVAEIKAGAWRYASDAKKGAAQIAADQKAAAQGNKEAIQRLAESRKAIAVLRQTAEKLTPDQLAMEKMIIQGGNMPAAPAPTPQAQQPAARPQANPGNPPEPGAKFYKGTWYRRGPNGESVPIQ